MVEADSHVVREHFTWKTQKTIVLFSIVHIDRKSHGQYLWPVITTHA